MSKHQASEEIVRKIADFLQNGPILNHFAFPRLHYPNVAGYKPEHYRIMGGLIRAGTVPVLIDESAPEGAVAAYQPESNRLLLTKTTAKLNTPEHWGTMTHEATHMIQDWKKWKVSLKEMEVDAHFAQALFMHYKGASFGGALLAKFATAAKAYASGDKKTFKNLIPKLELAVHEKYQNKKGYENMLKREKRDGI